MNFLLCLLRKSGFKEPSIQMKPSEIRKLQKLLESKPDRVPYGWYTVTQLMKLLKMCRNSVYANVRKLDKKNVKKRQFRIIRSNGSLMPVVHYKFKP